MSCGCGSAAKRREMLQTSRSAPTRDGGYSLLSYPDCRNLHMGAHQGDSIYVVGRNVRDMERLFRRSDLAGATQYANDNRLGVEALPTTGICDQAIIDLFAGA